MALGLVSSRSIWPAKRSATPNSWKHAASCITCAERSATSALSVLFQRQRRCNKTLSAEVADRSAQVMQDAACFHEFGVADRFAGHIERLDTRPNAIAHDLYHGIEGFFILPHVVEQPVDTKD